MKLKYKTYRNNMRTQYKNNKNKQKENLNGELKDWNSIDNVFGEVYSNNPYWVLREKIMEKEIMCEIKNQFEILDNLLSEYHSFKASIAMSDNIPRRVQKAVPLLPIPEEEKSEIKMKKCAIPLCTRRFKFTNNVSKKYEEHIKEHAQDQSFTLTLEATVAEEPMMPAKQPSPSPQESVNLLQNQSQMNETTVDEFNQGVLEDATVSTQNTLDVAGQKRGRSKASPDKNPELPKSRRVSEATKGDGNGQFKSVEEVREEIRRLEDEVSPKNKDKAEEYDLEDFDLLWARECGEVPLTDTMVMKNIQRDYEERDRKENEEEKKRKGEKEKGEKKKENPLEQRNNKFLQYQAVVAVDRLPPSTVAAVASGAASYASTGAASTASTGSSIVEIPIINDNTAATNTAVGDDSVTIINNDEDTIVGSPVTQDAEERLKAELERRNKTVADSLQREKALRADLQLEKIKSEKILAHVKSLEKKVSTQDEELKGVYGHVNELTAGITSFTQQVNVLNEALNEASGEKQQLFNFTEKQKIKLKEKTEWLSKLNEEIKKKEKENETLRKNNAEQEKRVETIEKNYNNLKENQERVKNSPKVFSNYG